MEEEFVYLDLKKALPKAHDALTAYAVDNPGVAWVSDDLYQLDFTLEGGLHPDDSINDPNCCVRATYNGRNTVTVYAGAVVETSPGLRTMTDTVLHEFRYSQPVNRRMINRLETQKPYNQQAHEVDANQFARDVMRYYQ